MNSVPVKIIAIVAMDEDRVIGYQNKLPWHIPEDMKRFSSLTTGHTVLMGRKTFQSLPEKYRPLPNRKNVVATKSASNFELPSSVMVISCVDTFIKSCKAGKESLPTDKVWVIGGAQVYNETINYWDEVYVTRVKGRHEGDVYFPEFEENFSVASKEDYERYSFYRYLKDI
jgi:dihydrofolate reductase